MKGEPKIARCQVDRISFSLMWAGTLEALESIPLLLDMERCNTNGLDLHVYLDNVHVGAIVSFMEEETNKHYFRLRRTKDDMGNPDWSNVGPAFHTLPEAMCNAYNYFITQAKE